MTNAAGQIWPHLQSDEPPKQQRAQSSLAGAMYPRQTAEQRAWDEAREREKQKLRRDLQALTARLKER
jgi:hypothetical protein